MEIEPEKYRPQYKVHKIFRVGGVKTMVGRVFGNNKNFRLNRAHQLSVMIKRALSF